VPKVSTTKGQESCPGIKSAYFVDLRISASIVADPTALDDFLMCSGASVSVQVKSHIRDRPLDQGIKLTPPGVLPFSRRRFGESSRQGVPDEHQDSSKS